MTCEGSPSVAVKVVRSVSCRPVSQVSASVSAATRNAPVSRTDQAMLYSGVPGESRSSIQSRRCVEEAGSTKVSLVI